MKLILYTYDPHYQQAEINIDLKDSYNDKVIIDNYIRTYSEIWNTTYIEYLIKED